MHLTSVPLLQCAFSVRHLIYHLNICTSVKTQYSVAGGSGRMCVFNLNKNVTMELILYNFKFLFQKISPVAGLLHKSIGSNCCINATCTCTIFYFLPCSNGSPVTSNFSNMYQEKKLP